MQKNIPKIRIGFVIDDGLDRPDGVQQYVLSLGKWLKEQGHYVCYLAGESKRKDVDNLFSLARNITTNFNGNRLSTPLPASKAKIKKVLKQQNLDVLHVQVPYSPFMAGRVIRQADEKTKIVGTFHVLSYGKTHYLGSGLLGYALKGTLKKFDNFISVSKPAQEFAKKSFKIDSKVIHNPVDIRQFEGKPKKNDDKLKIVFLGRLVPRKGCMQLLKALSVLKAEQSLPKIEVHICGDGPEMNNLKKYTKTTGLDDYVTFHGFVSETDKVKYLSAADLAVFPSLAGESFGIVLIEAMAAKAGVVLAANNPGYSSVMGEVNECLFEAGNFVSLARKMRKLLKDANKRKALHTLQQNHVKKFDVNIVGEELLKVYAS